MDFNHWLQSRLTAHGWPVGPVNGQIGPITMAALKAFQKARGLPVTGVADPATVEALRRSSSNAPGQPDRPASTAAGRPAGGERWPHQNDVRAFYGDVGTNQVLLDLPYPMLLAWDKRRTIKRISLNRRCAESAGRAFEKIAGTYTDAERRALGINLFGGSLNVRQMRGGTRYSMHSWGIAIDFDPERNGLHTRAPQARLSHQDAVPFWEAWEAEGWVSLGRARGFDWMHVQAARL